MPKDSRGPQRGRGGGRRRGSGGREPGGRGRGPGLGGRGRGLRSLLEPVLLLELRQGPSHGYALLDGLAEFDLGHLDPSVVYRVLREMEVEGWVRSSWDELQTQGPPRRVYRLSDGGEEALARWAQELEMSKSRIDRFLRTYRKTGEKRDEPERSTPE